MCKGRKPGLGGGGFQGGGSFNPSSISLRIISYCNFNSKKVTNAMEKATIRNLFKAGSFLRTISRNSLRKRAKSSKPGQPPTYRTSIKLFILKISDKNGNRDIEVQEKDFKRFKRQGKDVEIRNKAVKRGGALRKSISFIVNKAKQNVIVGSSFSVSTKIGGLHERGGISRVGFGKRILARYPARPFMLPALKKAAASDKLSSFWKNTLQAI